MSEKESAPATVTGEEMGSTSGMKTAVQSSASIPIKIGHRRRLIRLAGKPARLRCPYCGQKFPDVPSLARHKSRCPGVPQ